MNFVKIIDKAWKAEGVAYLNGIQHLLQTCVSKLREWNGGSIKVFKI